MDARLVVIVAGVILLAAIVGSLVFLRGYSGRFTFDTKNGTRPRASEGEGNTQNVAMKGRFQVLTMIVAGMFTALLTKVWSLQTLSSDYYSELSRKNQTRTVTTPAPRGRILDRNGEALVSNRASLTLAAYRDLADDAVAVRHLANVLGMPYMAVRRNIQNFSQSAQSLHTIATDVRRSTVAYVQEHADLFRGVQVVERTERVYPHGSLACHVLGYTGTVTGEQLSAQEKRTKAGTQTAGDITYQSGDIVGQAGVELMYESLLQGIRGEQQVTVDSNGSVTGQDGAVDPKPGSDIKLTLDLTIQQACEDGLKKAMEKGKQAGDAADAGACICMDCTTGEILGMASAPTFDPSVFIGGVASDVWNQLNSKESGTPMVNRAISGQYMSASTIKPLSALASMEYGVYTAEQSSNCVGWWTGLGKSNGRWCWLHSGHGIQNLRTGIVNSCDAVFYDVGKAFYYDKKNPEGLQEMFRRWGLGKKTGVDLPAESVGRVPDAAWKQNYFTNLPDSERQWNPGDMLNIAIGQGDILVTPLQMACVYAGLAERGVEWQPHVFLSAVARDGEGDAAAFRKRRRLKPKVNSSDDMDLIHSALEGVIYEESASLTAHFTNMNVKVAGKSGTGEKSGQDDYSWFITYAPADDPKYVVATVVEQGGFGAASAMHGCRYVLGVIYNDPDTAADTTGDQTR